MVFENPHHIFVVCPQFDSLRIPVLSGYLPTRSTAPTHIPQITARRASHDKIFLSHNFKLPSHGTVVCLPSHLSRILSPSSSYPFLSRFPGLSNCSWRGLKPELLMYNLHYTFTMKLPPQYVLTDATIVFPRYLKVFQDRNDRVPL